MFVKTNLFSLFIFSFFTVKVFAQQKDDYSASWKKAESLEKKELTQSALAEVIKIFNLAVDANNDAQQIKAAMYQMKYRNMVEEDNAENNIFYIDTLIAKTKAPAKNILLSMQAELFEGYRQNNRYKLYNRTQLSEEKSNDITTWSISKLNNTISTLYNASLENATGLKNSFLDNYNDILEKGVNTKSLRPTLYDFLAHRALAYFMNVENDITKPSYKFILNDEKIFSPVTVFVNSKFTTYDTSSLYYQAILLLQNILQFHLADVHPDALLDADLIRLRFANENGVFTNKDKLYEDALRNIESNYSNNPASAQAAFLRASLYKSQGNQYDPFLKKEFQFKIKAAKELCDSVRNKFPQSEGAINCKNLLTEINIPSLDLTTEKVNIAETAFRTFVEYKNINTLYLRVIKTSRDQLQLIQGSDYENIWQKMVKAVSIKSWSINLPDQQDYQKHSTEIKIDGLSPGLYIILASIKPDFNLQNNFLASQVTYVSNISYIINDKDELYVLDRDNGKPLPDAEVILWKKIYNNETRRYEEIIKAKYKADKNGYIKLEKTPDNTYNTAVFMQVKYKNDELFTDDVHYNSQHNNMSDPGLVKAYLFTDRSIYRPGQTVFFKGIVVATDGVGSKARIVPDFHTRVSLFDMNGQKAGMLNLVSNEYGSYNGSIKLTETGLNGKFYLWDSVAKSVTYINVEEYKRPKFAVEIKKPSGTYRVNDSITVIGNAKAYAGNSIDAAKLAYRVVRKIQYPIYMEWSRYGKIWPSYGSREEMEITNGEATTNANGEFFITFKTIPDENIDKKYQPVFYYEVSADITDINGETRSSTTSVAVAYQALQLNIIAPDKLDIDSVKNIQISSTNMNGLFEKTTVNLSIQKLQSPARIFRERYWQMPDLFTMTKEEYTKNFPYDEYADENDMNKWPVLQNGLEIIDTTSENSKFKIQTSKLIPGWYKFTVTTKDKYGEEVKAEKFIRLITEEQTLTDDAIVLNVKNVLAEPGQKIAYTIATGFDDINLIHSISKNDKSVTTNFPVITKSAVYHNEIYVTESDRGGINMNYAFVKHNRFYNGNQNFIVPWNNKDLNITYETFRDKILPGSQERWKIKITGNKSEKIAAETLISMYDASLDQFMPHSWEPLTSVWPTITGSINWNAVGFTFVNSEEKNNIRNNYQKVPEKSYVMLRENGWNENQYEIQRLGYSVLVNHASVSIQKGETLPASPGIRQVQFTASKISSDKNLKESDYSADSVSVPIHLFMENLNQTNTAAAQIRKNFKETAFFFPSLNTDANGNIEFSFAIPEALTTWKMMTLAHTKDLASAYSEKTIITQKPLMIQPNAPRFLREGDQIEFSAKVVNLSDSEITGTAQLELFDAATNNPVDGWFKNIFPVQYFTLAAGQSSAIKFPVDIPFTFNSALTYRIKAVSKDNSFSDGEEAALPVLTNRMLVTETLPLTMRNTSTKSFRFEKLLNSNTSGSLTNHALTVEYTSKPAWYAIQALPYLIEYPYECAEQSFNRYYANTLASFVSNSSPKIKAVFEKWLAPTPLEKTDTDALISNLQKNEELKSALLSETPWVLDAKNEIAQKKNIAVLFNLVRLSKEKENTLTKLKEIQTSNGGFSWFKGGRDDRYITQYIITGIGHLKKLHALNNDDNNSLEPIIEKALPYLDARLKEDYEELKRHQVNMKGNNLSYTAIQYLYMRSFFPDNKINNNVETAFTYYRNQAKKFWLTNSKYMQAMIALSLYRNGDEATAKAIINSLKENAIYKEETGMYFKEFSNSGYYWYQAPIESQAMMIEAFTDIDKNTATVDDLKTWLLKQKQTQNWKTTKATAEACYALLLNGNDWLAEEKEVKISLGNTFINSTEENTQEGTGYFKQTIPGDKVQQGMGNITVNLNPVSGNLSPSKNGTSWGAAYWQYFEDLDKITTAETPFKLVKKLFIEKNSDHGPVLHALNDGDEVKIGDKIKVRIELKADRDMEYIHMKDMRAACMEPVNVISGYKWQGGLGYYESTKDASTNFFFDWLPRGSYIFEYPMFVTHAGNFSNGITTIQCMYAPEFTSHSEGIRVSVTN